MSRSQNELKDILQRVRQTRKITNALYLLSSARLRSDRAAWEYRADSPLRDVAMRTYKELTGREAKVFATHGGLECGVFSDKLPGLDCIAFGPNMQEIHSVNERLDVASVARFYDLVCAILKNLK